MLVSLVTSVNYAVSVLKTAFYCYFCSINMRQETPFAKEINF